MIKGFVLGILATVAFVVVGGYLYLRFGNPPVAVADQPFPDEKQIVSIPLNARIDRQMSTAPFTPTAGDLIDGAHTYMQRCAVCHGSPGHPSDLSHNMYPPPPQLWEKNKRGIVGVSDDPPGKVYWKVKNGIRLTGMPSFMHLLHEKQMWQVTLLLHQAGQALPPEATATLDNTSEITQRQ